MPFQWVDEENRWVEPNTPGAEVDYGHLGVCTSVMAYCRDRTVVYGPSELDFAYLKDVGYDISDPDTASEPELYGYGAWGSYSAWGAGVERTIHYEGGRIIDATDTLRAAVDAFGMAPGGSLAANTALQGAVTWSGSLIGVDLGQAMLPPVFGDAELEVELSTLRGTASFDDLMVHVDGMSSEFRVPELEYDIGVAGNAFSDEDGHVRGASSVRHTRRWPGCWTRLASTCSPASAASGEEVRPLPLRHSRETGRVKTPTSGHERPLRHSRESGNPGVVEGCYGGVSPLHPAWIPAFAGMTISGAVASLGWGLTQPVLRE